METLEEISKMVEKSIDYLFTLYNNSGEVVYLFYYENSRLILDTMHVIFQSTFYTFLFITIFLASFYFFMALVTSFKRSKHFGKVEKGQEPYVTIQIPTYNELAALNCAKACLDFDYPKEKMQIIIGDDSKDKEVSKRIDAFAKKHPEIEVTRRGDNIGYKPGNLNHMLKYTKGEYIVIFDSDFLPGKDFLKKILAPFKTDDNISVVQARWNLYNFKQNLYSVLGGTITLLCHNVALPFISWLGGNTYLCGSAEVIKKKDLVEAGGWKAGSLTEDVECSFRLIKRGKRLVYLDYLECDCEAPHTLIDLCKQQMRWAYGVVSAFKLHFMGIIKSRVPNLKDKASVLIFASGYLFTSLVLLLAVSGVLSLMTDRPEAINWSLFLYETGRNVLLTSGFILTSVFALTVSNKITQVPRMIAASLSVGLAVIYYVNIGIAKALLGREMDWFILKKKGNEVVE